MNKFLFALIFISVSVFSQQEKDSIITVRTDTLFVTKDTIKKSINPKLLSDSDL
jgi:hypothetical protein